jgi:hypothetical protein
MAETFRYRGDCRGCGRAVVVHLAPTEARRLSNEGVRVDTRCCDRLGTAYCRRDPPEADDGRELVADGGDEVCANCKRATETNRLGLCVVCEDARAEGRIDPETCMDDN